MKFQLIILFLLSSFAILAQGRRPVPLIGETDSIPSYILEEANIVAVDIEFQKRYDRAKYYALRMYDYGMLASAMLNEFEDSLATMTSKRDQKKYIKEVNSYLKDEFGDEIADLSINSGACLMKIIHKETGLTSFDIINKYNGGMKAVWWQGVVKLFGATLKHEFDPLGEDDALAKVLREIESGKLKPIPRPAKSEKGKDALSKRDKKKLEKQKKKEAKRNEKK